MSEIVQHRTSPDPAWLRVQATTRFWEIPPCGWILRPLNWLRRDFMATWVGPLHVGTTSPTSTSPWEKTLGSVRLPLFSSARSFSISSTIPTSAIPADRFSQVGDDSTLHLAVSPARTTPRGRSSSRSSSSSKGTKDRPFYLGPQNSSFLWPGVSRNQIARLALIQKIGFGIQFSERHLLVTTLFSRCREETHKIWIGMDIAFYLAREYFIL